MITLPTIAMAGGKIWLNFLNDVTVAGTEIKAGTYDVKWESNDQEATVSFYSKGKVVAVVKGKIQQVDKKHEYDTFLSVKDNSGRNVVKEIKLAGKKFSIIFE